MKDALAKSVVRLQTLNRARSDILAAHYAQAEQEAMAELATHLHEPLFVAGVVAYWGEGDKQRRLAYGTATVIVMNTYFKKKLLLWIDQILKMVLNTVPSEEEINQRP